MTTDPTPKSSSNRLIIGLAALVLAAGVGLYAFYRGNDNPVTAQASCPDNGKIIAAVDKFARGELAAFQPVKESRNLRALAFKDKDGSDVTIADWQGRIVLLNLWATWCAPCRREMPALQKLQLELGGPGFEVVPVSIDLGDDSKPKAFYKKIGLNDLPFYADGTIEIFNTLKKMGLAFGMPTTVLLDTNGCSLGVINGPAEWASDDAKSLIKAVL